MKFKIIFFLFFTFFYTKKVISQHNSRGECNVTNYNTPTQDPWWYNKYWTVNTRVGSGTDKQAIVTSPFYSQDAGSGGSNVFPLYATIDKDYKYEKGWRCIRRHIGTSFNIEDCVRTPFFVFYNIYTAKVRILVLITQRFSETPFMEGSPPKTAFLRVNVRRDFSFSSNNPNLNSNPNNTPTSSMRFTPNVLTEYSNPSETVVENSKDKIYNIPQYWEDTVPFWIMGEFSASYDPCACSYFPNSRNPIIDFGVYATASENIEMCNFNMLSDQNCETILTENQETTKTQNVGKGSNIISNVLATSKNVGSTAKDIESAIPEVKSAFDKVFGVEMAYFNPLDLDNSDITGFIKFLKFRKAREKLDNITTVVSKISSYALLAVTGLEMIAPILKLFTGADEQVGSTGFQPFYSKGTITSTRRPMTGHFYLPGAFIGEGGSQINDIDVPEYNNVMGIMNVLEIPTLHGVVYENKPELVYYEVPSTPKIVVNPALNVDLSQSEISVSYEFDTDLKIGMRNPNVLPGYTTNPMTQAVNLDYSTWRKSEITGKPSPFYTSPLFPLNCVSGRAMLFRIGKEGTIYYGNIQDATNEISKSIPKNAYMKVVARLRRADAPDPKNDIVYVNRYLVNINYRGNYSENLRQGLIDKLNSVDHRALHVTYSGWYPSYPYLEDWQTNNFPVRADQTLTIIGGYDIPENVKHFEAGKAIEVLPINENGNESSVEFGEGTTLDINESLDITSNWACDRNNRPLSQVLINNVKDWCTNKNTSPYSQNHTLTRNQLEQNDQDSQASTSDLITELRVFPNPATGTSVEMAYSVSEQSDVTISVLGAKGEKIAELAQGKKDTGKYDIVWDITQVPNGLYFCTMEVNGKRIVKRLIIQK
jgi:hypothetical protein